MARATEIGENEALAMIKQRQGTSAAPEIDYEPESYGNMDEISEEEIDALEAPEAEAEEEEAAEAEQPGIDWEAIAQAQAEELARFRQEAQARKQADFEQLLARHTPEEQVELLKNHMKEQARSAELERVRQQEAEKHPVASILFGPISELFDIEVDDPAAYGKAMDAMEAKYRAIVDTLVEREVKAKMDEFYADAGKEWGVNKLGDAQARPPKTANPVRNDYEKTRAEMMQSKRALTPDDLTTLIRKRHQAKVAGR